MNTIRRTLGIFTLCLALHGLAVAAPGLDAQGKCRDNGKFVEARLCGVKKAPTAKCRDTTTKKFARCGGPNTEPVPKKP